MSLIRGGEVLDAPEHVEAVWGRAGAVAWPKGEPMIVVSPPSLGKSTLLQNVALARGDVHRNADVLGMDVVRDDRRVLYLAMDRPHQILRSMRRMVKPGDRGRLDERLAIWKGPLTFDVQNSPAGLADLAEEHGCGTVIADGLSDVTGPLSEDGPGQALKRALAHCVARDIEFAGLYHPRKGNNEKRLLTLDDVYGSVWITSGAGSVLALNGTPGDHVVDLRVLKPAAEDFGPLTVTFDHRTGRAYAERPHDLEELLATGKGVTVADAAALCYGVAKADKNQKVKTRSRLERLVQDGLAAQGGKDETGTKVYVGISRHFPPISREGALETLGKNPLAEREMSGNSVETARENSAHPLVGGALSQGFPDQQDADEAYAWAAEKGYLP